MVDNNLQQINTFVNGMNLDTSDQFLPDSSYREAINLRLTTDTNGNSGTLHSIEGVKQYQNIVSKLPTGYTDAKIIHTDSIRKYGIVVVKANKNNIENYFIFRFINKLELQENETGEPKLIFGPCDSSIGNNISSVMKYEDTDNIKFYYADGINPVRSINISPLADDIRPMTDDGSFSIYPTALLSQPEFISLGIGNLKSGAYQYGYQLFTKNGAETEISTLTTPIYPTGSTITPSTSREVHGADQDTNTGKSIQIKINIDDNKYDRIRIISVYYKDTVSIPLIQILKDINIIKDEFGNSSPIVYQDIDNVGVSNITQEEFNMITSIHFSPKVLESKNNYLFASDITYKDTAFDVEYDARAYSYAIDNYSNLFTVLRSNTGQPEIIASRESILNGTTIIPKDHDCVNPFSVLTKPSNSYQRVFSSDMNTENAFCSFCKHGQQILYGGEGLNISYRFTITELEEVSSGGIQVEDEGYYGISSVESDAKSFEGVWYSNVAYSVRSDTSTMLNTRFLRLSPIIKKDLCNYANPVIASKVKSLQRDEVYSYGIIFYNKFNQASPVKWIADIRIPDAGKQCFETFLTSSSVSFTETKSDKHTCALTVRPVGIEFIVKNIPSGVESYEIVSCKRTLGDRATITQGIVGRSGLIYRQTIEGTDDVPDARFTGKYFPFPYMMSTKAATVNGTRNIDSELSEDQKAIHNLYGPVVFSSPEVCYNYETLSEQMPRSNLKITLVKHAFSNASTIKYSDRGPYIYASSASKDTFYRKVYYKDFNGTKRTYYIPSFIRNKTDNFEHFLCVEQSNRSVTMNGNNSNFDAEVGTGSYGIVDSIIFPKEPSWKDFPNKTDYVDGISYNTYINWCATKYTGGMISAKYNDLVGIQGAHGRSIVLDTTLPIAQPNSYLSSLLEYSLVGAKERIIPSSSSSINSGSSIVSHNNSSFYNESTIGVQLCNIRKDTIPYGGYTYSVRQFRTYLSIGGFTKVVKQADGSSMDTSIVLFPGDTYINLFSYIHSHYFSTIDKDGEDLSNANDIASFAIYPTTIMYTIPVESSINLAMRYGANFDRYSQIQPSNIDNKYIQTRPLYSYNSIYSLVPSAKLHTPENIYDEYNKHIDTRTYYSLNKNNDEFVDQWTKFKPLNYLDVDSRYGSINNLRTFGNELIFWQSNAVGKFSVNERTLITDDSNQPLMLGTGGVLSRYDYLATVNGLKDGHNDSDCQSDHVLYWFDYDKHELCQYRNGEVSCISKAKYVQSYLNNLALSKADQVTKPMCTYDKYYNEMIATLSKNESLVYNENMQIFTAFYTLVPDFNLYFNNEVYFAKDNKLYQYNGNTENNGFGDTPLPIQLKFIVNKDYLRTKVFDNMEFTGFLNKDNISFTYTASGIESSPLSGSSITDREVNYRGAIPRANTSMLFGDRMRGRSLYCTMKYVLGNSESINIITNETSEYITTITDSDYIVTNINEKEEGSKSDIRFELPYVRTTYRISKS